MILLQISDNWYFFLVFAGAWSLITLIVLLFERKSTDDEILKLNPLGVITKILLIQGIFYLLYLYICFAIDLASFQRFRSAQVFSSVEFSFLSTRGLTTALALSASMASLAIPLAALIPTYKQMADYSFTVFVIHFIVVSIVQGEFPASGCWWTAVAVGFVACYALSERLSYQLSTMSYHSTLSGNTKREKIKKDEAIEMPQLTGGETADTDQIGISIEKDESSVLKKTEPERSGSSSSSSSSSSASSEEDKDRLLVNKEVKDSATEERNPELMHVTLLESTTSSAKNSVHSEDSNKED